MKKILIAAALSLGFVSVASAQQRELPTYETAAECLKKVCATVNGQTGCLVEGTHFDRSPASRNNDPFAVVNRVNVVGFPNALWDHPIWKTKKDEIGACVPGTTLVQRK